MRKARLPETTIPAIGSHNEDVPVFVFGDAHGCSKELATLLQKATELAPDCVKGSITTHIIQSYGKTVRLSVRRQLPVSFSDNYVFQQNLSSPVRIALAPMGAAENYVNSQGFATCWVCVVSRCRALLAGLAAWLRCGLCWLRTTRLLAGLLGFTSPLCFGQPVTAYVQLQDHAVVNETVDRGRGGHRVLEYLLPLAEREIARQQHAAAFVTLGQQREQNLHLFAALLHIADVVDDQGVALRKTPDRARKFQVTLGNQQLLHQQAACRKVDPAALPDQLLAETA